MDTCNLLLNEALKVFSGAGGITDQLQAMALDPPLPPPGSILKLSTAVDLYEKAAAVRYPVVTIYCERLRNSLAEKFRAFSGSALLVVEVRVSETRAEDLDRCLNSYAQAACQVLESSRGTWAAIGTYNGSYDVKFQPTRLGGKQFTKSARIEFEIQVSR